MRFDTKLVHEGQRTRPGAGDVVPPIHVSVTFDQFAQDPARYYYARGESPTREDLEACLAALEDVRFAAVFSSGQAAASAVLSLLEPGSRVIASDDVYGGTYALFELCRRRGVDVRQVDLSDVDAAAAALSGEVDLVWVETPTNPLMKIADIAAISAAAHRAGAVVVVDNTFASPALQQPLAAGADVSLHSTTKFIAGHSDVLGGALVLDDPALHRRLVDHRTVVGGVPGALDCYLVHRGLKTLSLRVARQVANARAVVEVLTASPFVGAVHYPGLPGHPQFELAARQMSAPGSMVGFEYLGDVRELLRRMELFAPAVSLGGVRSLIEVPASMSHRPVPAEVRARAGIADNLVRLSFGIEDPVDLVEDLSAAMAAAPHVERIGAR
ncbi:cystathionine gamma-lyase [Saccharothrix carnea]|uniref:homocysteine desulfhydrase n=1 Tax=Saccharothrix carnea TaxID=1280637 RepID=A0A2P8HCZ9_SACCR|nr:PLP-dependent aspartate aminotransferase family protein [Saccharothrix carnea]PSL44113.1 cystathionine gamma-lyase [Saccharothrix carnea]